MASNEGPKGKRTTWPQAEERHFLVICADNTITEQLDNCVKSSGVSTVLFKLVFFIWQTIVFVKSCRFL